MPRRHRHLLVTMICAAGVLIAACGTDNPAQPSDSPPAVTCEPGKLPTLTDGVLTVAAGDPYAPWYIGEYTSGEGFESALAYAVANELGYDRRSVRWKNVTFEQIISPSIKPFDFAAYQTSISPERSKVVDFSSPYLTTRQGVLVQEDGPYASATKLADLDGARIGVTAAQTSLTLAKAAFGEDATFVPYSAAGDGMQALTAGTIDAMVMDVDQGISAADQYFPDSTVIGTLPPGDPEQYGLVLDLDSDLTSCVSKAIDTLDANGKLAQLRTTWLASDDVPVLE